MTASRENIMVPQEEIARQKEFLHLIKEAGKGTLKKYVLRTYGCQMNENDSERLAGFLFEAGYTESSNEKDADLIIYNTCCVRENAELKVYGHLGALKSLKHDKPGLIIAVCGCMMQQKEVVEEIRYKYPQVDMVFGTHNLFSFPELFYGVLVSGDRVFDIRNEEGSIAEGLPIERKEGVKAWVTIMYGCNNFCSYCIVPYVRGRERSRQVSDILTEIEDLGSKGYKEVTLLGQNVNSYGKDLNENISFSDLLREADKVKGIERLRFMTSHPKDLSDELIAAVKDCSKVCSHIHLPVQSGSSRILEKMNRKYTKEHYIELADRIRAKIPDIALTTDIIVGFPGETEEDFKETLDLIEKIRFDFSFTFLYSKRTGTPAAKSVEQVPDVVKKERFNKLVALQNTISREINNNLLGYELEVLVEGLSKNSINKFAGRTSTNKIVNFEGANSLVGKLVNVKIERVQTWSLEGRITSVI